MSLEASSHRASVESIRIWEPTGDLVQHSQLGQFFQSLVERRGLDPQYLGNYQKLWQWSVQNREMFWAEFWNFARVVGTPSLSVLSDDTMPGARWFPNAKLNYAENLLRPGARSASAEILYFCEGMRTPGELWSAQKLESQVHQASAFLKSLGVAKGDRVAGVVANQPEAIVFFLAAASLGAVWSSASPDFGVQGILDRLGQIEPRVVLFTDEYIYGGKSIDCRKRNFEVLQSLPTVTMSVHVNSFEKNPTSLIEGKSLAAPLEFPLNHKSLSWSEMLHRGSQQLASNKFSFEQVEFSHPLMILFSSGTTGLPKCIVHGHGGTLLQHLKEHRLHADVGGNDSLFYFTTCGWMMWNWLVSGLASAKRILLFDGNPLLGDGKDLFSFLSRGQVTHLGTSAKFIEAQSKSAWRPMESELSFSQLRNVLSTGSPLSPEGFLYVQKAWKPGVAVSSISGGTDIVSCFLLGNPWSPIFSGELQGPGLGMKVEVYNDQGKPKEEIASPGELVCEKSFPSMPVGFWKDSTGKKYSQAYFEKFPGVWCHGDWVSRTSNDGYVISGRSDAVLNPGGVRIGTAEIYRAVELLPEVLESVAIGQNWKGDVRVVLFVRLRQAGSLTGELIKKIQTQIRQQTTARHVPAVVCEVTAVPRTRSGKLVEIAIRDLVHGKEPSNLEALANPEALEQFRNRPELLS